MRVGVLGAGAWAEFAHLPGYKRDPRCELVASGAPKRAMITQTITLELKLNPNRTPMSGTNARIGMACSATA